MAKIMLLAIFAVLFANSYLHNFLASAAEKSQHVCRTRFETAESYKTYYRAAVCGERLGADDPARQKLLDSSLSRYLMVSGTQVFCLELLLSFYFHRRSGAGRLIEPLALAGYALMTGLGPAAVRILLNLLVDRATREEKLGWPPLLNTVFAGVLALVSTPKLVTSSGFMLSWLAAIWVRALRPIIRPRQHPLAFAVCLFILLSPLVAGLPTTFTPQGVLSWALRPVIATVLIVPCFVVAVFPVCHHLVDPIWRGFIWIASHGEPVAGVVEAAAWPSLGFTWVYFILCLTVAALLAVDYRTKKMWPRGVASCEQ